MAKFMKKAQRGNVFSKDSVDSEMFPGKRILRSKSNYENGNYAKMLQADKKSTKKVNIPDRSIDKEKLPMLDKSKASKLGIPKSKMKSGGMLKRADGSYSKRGLWDNIRAAKGSGKKPTAAMLKQEKKIKAKTKK
jgi:hypothetical protein